MPVRRNILRNIHSPLTGYLVVEGFINAGNGPTNIQLSRTTGLDSVYFLAETGALVEVQSENGPSYLLGEQAPGKYFIDQLPVNSGQKYRLHIRTINNKDYTSAYTDVKITPEIDSVNWKETSDGVSLYVSTHDQLNQTKYYQWQFEETWKYHTKFQSYFKYIDPDLIYRKAEEMIYTCWRSDLSTNIVLASSVKLQSDVIFQFPIANISTTSTDKLNIRYSVLVKQYALTKDWYEWKQKVKKNTEQLGSIFDAQPSETGGNIHCDSDPNERAIGFIGCTTQTEKRIFIDHSELNSQITYTGYENCASDTAFFGPTYSLILNTPTILPIDYAYT